VNRDRAEALALARNGALVPVIRSVVLDAESPVGAFAKLRRRPFAFLLESLVGGERWARYTFLGTEPREVLRYREGHVECWSPNGWRDRQPAPDPLGDLASRLAPVRVASTEGLPPFLGGAVGVWGYDLVHTLERLPPSPPDDLGLPDALVMLIDTMVVIDNLYGRAALVTALAAPPDATDAELGRRYDEAMERLAALEARLKAPGTLDPLPWHDDVLLPSTHSPYPRAAFERDVREIKAAIAAGECFQAVLSRRQDVIGPVDPFLLYRYLRALNPAPYLYLLQFDGVAVVGSSPEALVRVEDGQVIVRPIAGTRPRGASQELDVRLAEELRADPKERAEHLMLVDLGRNDVGRVAELGSVQVSELLALERYSHVQHLVSEVRGQLRSDLDAFDALRAAFPAGTVSGAPKIRAMEILNGLEPSRRGFYAGAVGHISWGARSLDTAIAIRTAVVLPDKTVVQAGAGIVADSDPAREYEETEAKAQAVLRALARALGPD